MNKFILISGLLLSFSLFAQDALELDDSNVEINPDTEVTSQNDGIVPEEAAPMPEATAAEDEGPVETEETEASVTPEETPAEEFVENEKSEQSDADTAAEVASTPANVMKTEVDEDKEFNIRESHWFSHFAFEGMEYQLPYEYTGVKESFSEERRKLYGGRLGVGGEVYLGAGFMFGAAIEGYYMGTLFEKAKTADPEIDDLDVASSKDEGQIYGGDAVATFSFLWDFKTKNPFMDEWAYLNFEPFIEAGIGKAWAYNKKDYFYDTGAAAGTGQVQEAYDVSYSDELTNARVGGGFKLTSRQGFFFFLKATQNRYDITKRRQKGFTQQDDAGQVPVNGTVEGAKIDAVMVYSLGGGYRF